MQCKGKPSHTILSAEGVTQGDPLSMVLYGLALVPLVDQLAKEVPGLLQPWYADNAAMAGPASKVREAVTKLMVLGPACGNYPKLRKTVVVCHPDSHPDVRQSIGS